MNLASIRTRSTRSPRTDTSVSSANGPVAYLLIGLTGSGKTTYARALEAEGVLRLSVDEEVFARHGRYSVDYPECEYPDREAPVVQDLQQRLIEAVRAGQDVVLDYGLWRRAEREAYKRMVEDAGGRWRLIYLKVDRAELLRRLGERNLRTDANALAVTPEMLGDFYARFDEPLDEGQEIVTPRPVDTRPAATPGRSSDPNPADVRVVEFQGPNRTADAAEVAPVRLPGELAAFAEQVLGPLAAVADLSWPYEGSEVYRVTDAHGIAHIVKRLINSRFYAMESAGYVWAAGLGPDRAARLEACDPTLRVVISTFLPGEILSGAQLDPYEENEAYLQAGQLLALLHQGARPVPDTAVIDRQVERADGQLGNAWAELTGPQRDLARRAAALLAELAPRLHAVPTHGDFQPRNLLFDRARQSVAVIDFEKAALAPAVRDLVRLEAGVLARRPHARAAFYRGYGRALEPLEAQALAAWVILDSVSALAWGLPNGDTETVERARSVFASNAWNGLTGTRAPT
jgi:predicted kinase